MNPDHFRIFTFRSFVPSFLPSFLPSFFPFLIPYSFTSFVPFSLPLLFLLCFLFHLEILLRTLTHFLAVHSCCGHLCSLFPMPALHCLFVCLFVCFVRSGSIIADFTITFNDSNLELMEELNQSVSSTGYLYNMPLKLQQLTPRNGN